MGIYSFGSGGPTYNGVPMAEGATKGLTSTYFVDYTLGSDGVSAKSNSLSRPFKTIDKALDVVTTNKNEGIALVGNATHTLTEMLTVSKSRVHIFGYDPGGRLYGQNAKISLGATTAATDIATILNTGVRNSFRNLKIMNSNTVDEGLYCVAEGGEYTVYDGVEIYKSTDLDETTAAEMLHNGDSVQMYNCTIGSLADIVADNKIRPCVSVTATLSGKKFRDGYFQNCMFWRKAAGTESVMIYGANATDVERLLLAKNCTFISNALGAATPAHAVGFGAAQTQGSVLLQDCASVDCAVMAEAAVGIYVSGSVPIFATTGVSVAS